MARPFARFLIGFAILGLALVALALVFVLKSPEPSAAAYPNPSDKGQRPKSANDLVPGYLKSIPLDPFTGTNLVYRP